MFKTLIAASLLAAAALIGWNSDKIMDPAAKFFAEVRIQDPAITVEICYNAHKLFTNPTARCQKALELLKEKIGEKAALEFLAAVALEEFKRNN